MARTRGKIKGRREDAGTFVMLPHAVLASDNYCQLSAHAVKMLIDLFGQFKGTNNGDFSAAWTIMRKTGWKSRDTLWRALRELERYGFIVCTRRGGQGRQGRKLTTLWGVTWIAIDHCGGKLHIPSGPSLGTWRKPPDLDELKPLKTRDLARLACQTSTPAVLKPTPRQQLQHAGRADSAAQLEEFNTPRVPLLSSTKGSGVIEDDLAALKLKTG